MTSSGFLVLLAAIGLASTLTTLMTAALARALGVGVPAVEFGIGRPRLERQLHATRVRVTPWLLASSCTLKDDANLDLYGELPGRSFGTLHPLVRVAVVLAGPLAMLAACVAIGGPGAFTGFLLAFDQIVAGALSPLGQAQVYLAGFWRAAEPAPVVTGAALLAKFMAFQLLPLPMLAGGSAWLQLARWRQPDLPTWTRPTIYVGLVLILAMVGAWTVALAAFLTGRLA